jgi:hypothetical protein
MVGVSPNLNIMSDITVQAIFASTLPGVPVEKWVVTEAARMAQDCGYNKYIGPSNGEQECSRTFWVVYSLEKTFSFITGRTSVSGSIPAVTREGHVC